MAPHMGSKASLLGMIAFAVCCASAWAVNIFFLLWLPFGWLVEIMLLIWSTQIDQVPFNGKGRASFAFRNGWWWDFFRSYFPVSLRQEEEFDSSKRYLFVVHPHGILGFSAWLTFAADCTGFSKKNHNLDIAIATVKLNFFIPFWRDIVLAAGFLDASFSSLYAALHQNRSVTVVCGGAAEALEAHPDTCNIILNKRKGIIRLALMSGTPLVPVFAFGENDLFYQWPNPNGSLLRTLQEKILKIFKFSTPIIIGEGILLRHGFLPRSRPLHVVTGKPLIVPHVEDPDDALIQEYQSKYRNALVELYNVHSKRYYTDILPESMRPPKIPQLKIVA